MATIQVRNVPDDVHRTYRMRAAGAGMSLQEFLLFELVRNARLSTPAEVVAEVESGLRIRGGDGFAEASSAAIIRSDREGG